MTLTGQEAAAAGFAELAAYAATYFEITFDEGTYTVFRSSDASEMELGLASSATRSPSLVMTM